MASWRRPCSSRHAPPTERPRAGATALLTLAALGAGCGHAGDRAPSAEPAAAEVPPTANAAASPQAAAAAALCVPAETGSLKARLQGAIDVEIDWGADSSHCQGGVRPQGDGIRLLYKGYEPATGPLLLVFGAAPLKPGESARNVPVNLTVVREGTGQFFATQGDDKCAFDSVTQTPADGNATLYRLEGRGYCTQPARAVGGDGAVLLSRFDVVALVPAAPPAPSPEARATESAQ